MVSAWTLEFLSILDFEEWFAFTDDHQRFGLQELFVVFGVFESIVSSLLIKHNRIQA